MPEPRHDIRKPGVTQARLTALRRHLQAEGMAGLILPRGDEHQGEYVAAYAERLAWLTGFTGSAGVAAVLAERAALFVDGRYTIQAERQVDAEAFEQRHLVKEPLAEWLSEAASPGDRIAYDPWLHTRGQIRRLRARLAARNLSLVALVPDAIDAVWLDRPAPPQGAVSLHDLAFSGEASADKRARMADALVAEKADALVLSKPDSLAWLLNVRGSDVPHTPLVLSFGLLRKDGALDWFVDAAKISDAVWAQLGNEVTLRDPADFARALADLGRRKTRVLLDPEGAADAIVSQLEATGAAIVEGRDPCVLAKACKNAVELAGTRAAHDRDGLAVTRFLAWLAKEAALRAAAGEPITELEAAAKLQDLRSQDPQLRDLSFDTISAAGPNAALAHYRVTEDSNRALGVDEIYLCDSGGQYPDGTTDVTRTIAIGLPDGDMKDRFTRVLKGHIALARARFPEGTTGGQLDSLARAPLWEIGCDYDHGTGHGVGVFLSVHEGPQRIAKAGSGEALRPGMILSNEPGYYRADAYGIRIENLIVVKTAADAGGDKPVLQFENLTWAPIDRNLIDVDLLNGPEIDWLDNYHRQVWDRYGNALEGTERDWLAWATAPLSDSRPMP